MIEFSMRRNARWLLRPTGFVPRAYTPIHFYKWTGIRIAYLAAQNSYDIISE